jgi:diguanylate cyclase (GGDEF)-like protein
MTASSGDATSSAEQATSVDGAPCCMTCGQLLRDHAIDELTGLAERSRWDAAAEDAFARAREQRQPVALIIVDLDHFKYVNDEYGHPAGDDVLRSVAAVLRAATRDGDLIGRYGRQAGDEFLILLRATDLDGAKVVAERIRAGIKTMTVRARTSRHSTVTIVGQTASLGTAACFPARRDDLGLSDLLLDADVALRAAKRAGRGRTRVASPSMTAGYAETTGPGESGGHAGTSSKSPATAEPGRIPAANRDEPPAGAEPDDSLWALTNGDWTDEHTVALGEMLRNGAELPITADTVTRLVHDWLVIEPPQIVEVRAGRRIGDALVSKVERRVTQLRRMDDFVAGGDLHHLVVRELCTTADLVRNTAYSEQLGRRLLVAVGELCLLAGWVTSDAGQHAQAARYYSIGLKAAHAGADLPLAANLISTLSYQTSNVGDPRDAVRLARTAATGARHRATSATHALLEERVAWAHARAGERCQTEQALAAVETHYQQRQAGDDPQWMYWLNEREISVMAARCFVELGMPERAVPRLAETLVHYDERMTRELALYTSWLAEAQIMLGDVDEAVASATRTLELTTQITSARGDDRINLLRHKLLPYKDVQVVQNFDERLRELDWFESMPDDDADARQATTR